MKSKIIGEETVSGIRLRPWTLATRKFLMSIIPNIDEQTGENDVQQQIITLVWIQSNEPRFVDESIRDGTYKEKLLDFEYNFPLHAFPSVSEWAAKQAKAIQDAVVTVVPKPDSKSKETPPKN